MAAKLASMAGHPTRQRIQAIRPTPAPTSAARSPHLSTRPSRAYPPGPPPAEPAPDPWRAGTGPADAPSVRPVRHEDVELVRAGCAPIRGEHQAPAVGRKHGEAGEGSG